MRLQKSSDLGDTFAAGVDFAVFVENNEEVVLFEFLHQADVGESAWQIRQDFDIDLNFDEELLLVEPVGGRESANQRLLPQLLVPQHELVVELSDNVRHQDRHVLIQHVLPVEPEHVLALGRYVQNLRDPLLVPVYLDNKRLVPE